MKRIIKIIPSFLFICLIPFSMAAGQEKKNEQKIKIIIDDGSGKKVVIDTLLNDNQLTDSLKLKNGNVIYIGHAGDNVDLKHHDGNEQVFVTVSADGKDTKKIVKEITIIRSDSAKWEGNSDVSRVYVYNDSNSPEGNSWEQHNKVIHRSDKDGNGPGDKIIIINDKKADGKDDDEKIEYTVSSDDKKSDGESTKYVINKDGMVITIEGNDYNKVKELVKEIENKLDAGKDETKNSKSVNAEQKKAVKK